MREAETHFNRGEYLDALADYQEVLEQAKAGDHRPKALMMSATIHSTFLKDHEQIKQFENLFAAVDTVANITIDDINIAAGDAGADRPQSVRLLRTAEP